MLDVVSTEYQEKTSAVAIVGSSQRDTVLTTALRESRGSMRDISRNSKAHCAAKHISAKVATLRPTSTLDRKLSTSTRRCTSNTGHSDRKPHPST